MRRAGGRAPKDENVPLRRVRPRFRQCPRRRVQRPGRPAAGRRDHRGPVPAAPADERRLSAASRLHAARRHPLRHAELASSSGCSATSRANTTRATAISRRARTSSTTGRRCPTCRRSWPISARVEMHAIQTSGQLHPQRHRRPLCRVLPPTRSPTRVPMPRSCGSGRRCTRNFPTCRASSRSR